MAHVVVIGASTGGLPSAYELRDILDINHRITVVSNTPIFHFVPSNPWVAVGLRKRKHISFDLAPVMREKGIDFYDAGVKEIEAKHNRLSLNDGTLINYDYLLVATGPKLSFDEIEGLGPEGFTESICTVDHAEDTYSNWRDFMKNPGPIVVGAVQGASCFGPAYEFAMIMNQALRKAKIRDKVPMTFVTPEPYIGHLGVGGIGDSKGLFESEFRKNDIKWITNARVKTIEEGKMLIEQVDEKGELYKTHQLPFNFSMLIPAFKGVDCIANLGEEAVNPRGFLKVNHYQQSPVYENIFGVGVCIAIAPVEPTPLAVGVPKTGYMIESMAKAAAHNIKAMIDKQAMQDIATWNAICLADMGNTGAAFIAEPQVPPRNVAWMKKARWVLWMKKAFEQYFIFKMKRGLTETWLEKYFLKLIKVHKLK